MKRICKICSAEFETDYEFACYCGSECRKEAQRRVMRERNRLIREGKKKAPERKCLCCGKMFGNISGRKTCSDKCEKELRSRTKRRTRPPEDAKCKWCGEILSGGRKSYCSNRCRMLFDMDAKDETEAKKEFEEKLQKNRKSINALAMKAKKKNMSYGMLVATMQR